MSTLVSFLIVLNITAAAAGAYVTPLLVALGRRTPNVSQVAVVDLLLGWSVIGWIVALTMALRPMPAWPASQYVAR